MPFVISTEPTPKHKDRLVIAQISDLHFSASTNVQKDRRWLALCEDLNSKCEDIDLVTVTGDVIDSSVFDNLGKKGVSKELNRAKEYLLQGVCPAAKVDPKSAMLVIPGNHDFRLTGLIWKDAQFDYFHKEFDGYFGHRLYENLKLCLFMFDSNCPDRPLNLASGLVNEKDLIEHKSVVRQIEKEHPDFWNVCTRVVLVHHHPMPIPATQHREDVLAGEEFMLLKNAGLFMVRMANSRMDLVLHGHRHYPAFSRVSYRTSDKVQHSMAIVAAGSVGKNDDHPFSYNLITVSHGREISLERRVYTEDAYDKAELFFITNYEEARQKNSLPKKDGKPQIRADKYIRVDAIRAGSGDAVIDETFLGAQSVVENPIDKMPRTLTSHSGVFGEWTYETPPDQKMEWHWQGLARGADREGFTKIDPPLGSSPITFSRHGTTFNAIHFNQRDRLDATDQQAKSEWIDMKTRHIYDSAILQVCFPPKSFPSDFRVEVRRPNGEQDDLEQNFLRQRLTRFPSTCSAILVLPKPLPDYSYRIVWDLPPTDIEELNLSATDKGLAATIVRRLLSLRARNSPLLPAVKQALANLRVAILSENIYQSQFHDDQLEAELFAYDEQQRGLVFTATLSDHGDKLLACVIKPGRYVVGQAFRRRAEVVLINVEGIRSDGSDYYEKIPGLEHLAPHTVIFSLPLFYPVLKGAKVGALALGSRSLTSGLLCLENDPAALVGLKAKILAWYAEELAPALGLGVLSVEKAGSESRK